MKEVLNKAMVVKKKKKVLKIQAAAPPPCSILTDAKQPEARKSPISAPYLVTIATGPPEYLALPGSP